MISNNKFVSLNEAVAIIKNLKNDELFELNDLSRLIKSEKLNLYVEFLNPESSPVLGGAEAFEDGLPNTEKEFQYKDIEKRAIANPIETDIYLSNAKSYNIKQSVKDSLIGRGFFEYFSKGNPDQPLTMPYELNWIELGKFDDAEWVINSTQLRDYFAKEEQPNKEFWKNLKEGLHPIGMFLSEVAKAYCGEQIDFPDFDDMLIWLEDNKNHKCLKKYEIKIDLMMHQEIITQNIKTPLKPHLFNRWNKLIEKSNKIKKDLNL